MSFKSKVRWGREPNDGEVQSRIEHLRSLEEKIVRNGGSAVDGVGTHEWVTLEDAQNWVNFVNTFTPPPISAEAVEE